MVKYLKKGLGLKYKKDIYYSNIFVPPSLEVNKKDKSSQYLLQFDGKDINLKNELIFLLIFYQIKRMIKKSKLSTDNMCLTFSV